MSPDPHARDRLLNDLHSTLTPASGLAGGEAPQLPPVVPDHELIRCIGRGSYGEVWLGRTALGTWRAVKIVHRAAFDHDRPYEREFEGIRRFEPVSRTHPSQLNVLHVGRNAAAGHFYYVMELADPAPTVAGLESPANPSADQDPFSSTYTPRTLRSELHQRGRLPFEECLDISLALATALDHLHRHKLVHRDIKPANIVFVNGIPKLADIGLVAQAEATLSLVGTEGYLPPEGPGTPQADIFSLGKVLYEISTGRDRQDFPELPTNLIESPASERANLAELNEVIIRACHADPKQRYQTAAQLHADLALIKSGKSVTRLRTLERRLRVLQRTGAVIAMVAMVIAGGWLWQARQTRMVRDLAEEKSRLAAEKSQLADTNARLADTNAHLAAEGRERLVRLDIANGVRLLDAQDPSAGLLWFADALPMVTNDPAATEIHRIRIQQTLQQIPRLRTVVAEDQMIASSALSPDARQLATVTFRDDAVTLRDAQSEKVLWKRPSDGKVVRHIRFSRDGRHLLVASAETQHRVFAPYTIDPSRSLAGVLSAASGEPAYPLLSDDLTFSAFSADDRWLAAARTNHVIQVLDALTGRPAVELRGHTHAISALAFSADGGVLASGGHDKTVRLWRLPDGEPMGPPLAHEDAVVWVALSPDGKHLATATGTKELTWANHLTVWEVATRTKLGEAVISDATPTRSLFFSPKGDLLIASGEAVPRITPTVSVFEVVPGLTLKTNLVFPSVRCSEFSPDGRFLALGTDNAYVSIFNVQTWELEPGQCRHTEWVYSVHFSRDGTRLLTTSADGTAKIWALEPLAESARLELPSPLPTSGADKARPRGRTPGPLPQFLMDRKLHLIDPERFVELKSLDMPGGANNWIAGPVGRHWLLAGDGLETNRPTQFVLWTKEEGVFTRRSLPVTDNRVLIPQFNADESRIFMIALDDRGVNVGIWRTADASLERNIALPEGMAVWAPDGLFEPFLPHSQSLVVLFDEQEKQRMGLFDLATGLLGPRSFATADAPGVYTRGRLSPNRTHVAFAGLQRGVVLDLQKGEWTAPPFHIGNIATDLDWSPDGRRLITAGNDPEVKIWDAATGEMVLAPLSGREGASLSARWSADGRFIATRNDDNNARVWDASTAEPVTPFLPHAGYIQWVCITPGNRLVTASRPNLLRAWDLTPSDLPTDLLGDYAKLLSGRRLTQQGFLLNVPARELAELAKSLRTRAPRLFE